MFITVTTTESSESESRIRIKIQIIHLLKLNEHDGKVYVLKLLKVDKIFLCFPNRHEFYKNC